MIIDLKLDIQTGKTLMLSNVNELGTSKVNVIFANIPSGTVNITFGPYVSGQLNVINGEVAVEVTDYIPNSGIIECVVTAGETQFRATFKTEGYIQREESFMLQQEEETFIFRRILTNLRMSEIINLLFPIGHIIESTNPEDPTKRLGGKWERFGNGKVLVGVDENQPEFESVEKSGGHKEMQRHNHGTVKATWVNNHGHSFTGNRTLVEKSGNHSHKVTAKYYTGQTAKGTNYARWNDDGNKSTSWGSMNTTGEHQHYFTPSGSISAAGGHDHNVTIPDAGGGDAGNLQPYITVYRWVRME